MQINSIQNQNQTSFKARVDNHLLYNATTHIGENLIGLNKLKTRMASIINSGHQTTLITHSTPADRAFSTESQFFPKLRHKLSMYVSDPSNGNISEVVIAKRFFFSSILKKFYNLTPEEILKLESKALSKKGNVVRCEELIKSIENERVNGENKLFFYEHRKNNLK